MDLFNSVDTKISYKSDSEFLYFLLHLMINFQFSFSIKKDCIDLLRCGHSRLTFLHPYHNPAFVIFDD